MEPTPSQCHLCNEIHSLKYFVAHVNGHYEGTCVNTKLWSLSYAQTFLKKISFITVEHDMDHIVEGWDHHVEDIIHSLLQQIIHYCGTWYKSH
jgi:hypothetical protein